MSNGQASHTTTSSNRDIPQSYQPEEGADNEDQQQEKHNQVATSERRDRSSEDVTEAPEAG